MAPEDSSMIHSMSMHEEDDDHYYEDQPPHNLSRLSICSNNTSMYDDDINDAAAGGGVDDDGDHDDTIDMKMMFLSRLSIEGSEGFADDEQQLSEGQLQGQAEGASSVLSTDSDDVSPPASCCSRPATPPRSRRTTTTTTKNGSGSGSGGCFNLPILALGHAKEYASDNEARKTSNVLGSNNGRRMNSASRSRRSSTVVPKDKWLERCWEKKKMKKKDTTIMGFDEDLITEEGNNSSNGSFSTGEGECLLIARPNGGRRSLCMDLEEVKACRDLGFELEHRGMEIPSRISVSGSTIDTSSGGNSPIANWRISSPGDDPRDVKARLKVWAQAVALASTSRLFS